MSEDAGRFDDPNVVITRVYTRTGDKGTTRLVGGQVVDKDDLRIECYGTVDELNAHVGGARLACQQLGLTTLANDLFRVQHALFNLGSLLATLPADLHPKQPRVTADDVAWLEERMDACNADLPALKSFVLPGGNAANIALHHARTVCRRAERLCVQLGRREDADPAIVRYLNRLSDAFFVWSRTAAHAAGDDEVLWQPNLG
jgi:cob(I)alamin adenosyltransferase